MVRFFQNDIYSNPGDPMHALYKPVVDKDGNVDLELAGYEDTNEIIQSYGESCDITTILRNCSNGDFSGLNQARGVYGDFTNMPKTYAEMLQLQIDAKRAFDRLPTDIKQKFDNDVNKFMSIAGNDEWFEKVGVIKEVENVKVEDKGDVDN